MLINLTVVIALINIGLIVFGLFFYQYLLKIKKQFNSIKKEYNDIKQQQQILNNLIIQKRQQLNNISVSLEEKEKRNFELLAKIQQIQDKNNYLYNQQRIKIQKQLNDFKEISQQAAQQYFTQLEKSYNSADAAYKQKITSLKAEESAAAADLEAIKRTRQEVAQAILKEAQIKAKADNYRLLPSQSDLQDIHTLEKIKQTLHKPRILSMLIWQTYFQPLAKKQFPLILFDKTKMGIYRISNLKTDQFYIGQSVDIYKRWTQHCKAGLGIDTPVGNKLYKAMQEYGLQNFTFELLCQCSKQQLDEKEKYFIELYQADLYGYNSQKGNK